MAQISQRPAFGNGPLAQVIVAFALGAFVVMAFFAYSEAARDYEAAPESIKRECAGKLIGSYRNCVLREAARQNAQ